MCVYSGDGSPEEVAEGPLPLSRMSQGDESTKQLAHRMIWQQKEVDGDPCIDEEAGSSDDLAAPLYR